MQMDYVLSFPQEPVERECYMNTPKGIEVRSDTRWLIKVNKNIYGQLQEGIVWNKFLVETLTSTEAGFREIKID